MPPLHRVAVSVADVAYRRVVRPEIFRTDGGDAEAAHERAVQILGRFGTVPPARTGARLIFGARRHPVRVAGIDFPGMVGLAAGMDKNGIAAQAWESLGFGFAELGTVTPLPQPGNPRPRLFRLPHSHAVINRMGFNNAGARALAGTLDGFGVRRGNRAAGIPLGISIGRNKATPLEDTVEDYLTCYRLLGGYADYLAVNVSSPNTPGLRALQDATALTELITALTAAARDDALGDTAGGQPPLPIMIKIAPDLDETALEDVLQVAEDAGVAGVIATNTTLGRDQIAYQDVALAPEAGGLSGAPVHRRARHVVGFLAERTSLPVIGVGGIGSAADAEAMVDAGASLLQVLTGFIYDGPGLLTRINATLGSSGRAIGGEQEAR